MTPYIVNGWGQDPTFMILGLGSKGLALRVWRVSSACDA